MEYTKDIHTKTRKINASIFIREDIQYKRIGYEINNAVIIEVPESKIIVCVCYARH